MFCSDKILFSQSKNNNIPFQIFFTKMQFQHSIVGELFKKDYRISRDILLEIKDLGSEVEKDLLAIVDDAISNPDYYSDDIEDDEGGFAPMHAILLLREIKSKEVAKRVIQMLQGDVLQMDRVFYPDFLTEEVWTYICHLGHQEIDTCKKILFEGNADVYARVAISTGLAQLAVHYPEHREKVMQIFTKLLEFILSDESMEAFDEEEGSFGEDPDFEADIEFISNFACDLLDLDAKEKRKELDALFENGLIDEEILEESKAVFKKNQMSYKNILEIYMDMEIGENAELIEEDEDEDEPKVKKMKD
ncbi:hypothetical protein AD998_16335 [bacterium 336/3]|nr:hypothetical protein AD998_16335 [bacterium 336/3]